MALNIIGEDIKLMRIRYDEALEMQGIPCSYQYPINSTSNSQSEIVLDGLSDPEDIHIFFDSNPKLKTYKRLGWVVENDKNLPFLVHCSFHLENLQRGSIFRMSGMYTGMPERIFRVTELTCDMQAPDHMIAQVVPVYDNKIVGETKSEIKEKYKKSNHYLKKDVDYRGKHIDRFPGGM